ncbi:MAG: hypothetical protein ACYC9O_18495 [Candidatus Latescibacterota bacterium]
MRRSAVFCLLILLAGIVPGGTTNQQDVIVTRRERPGCPASIFFETGKEWSHTEKFWGLFSLSNPPQIAVWVTDTDGRYLETLFVTRRTARQDWRTRNDLIRRPESLPFWAYSRGVVYEDGLRLPTRRNPLSDAVTGATPPGAFRLETIIPDKETVLRVCVELNHAYDFNEFFPKGKKYGEDRFSGISGQPSIVYSAEIELAGARNTFRLRPVGCGSPDGSHGKLCADLSKLTTAKRIVKRITVQRK